MIEKISVLNAMKKYQQDIVDNGFTIINDIYTNKEVGEIIEIINQADSSKQTFRKSNDIFAIRQFLKEIPKTQQLIFSDNLKRVISQILGGDYFVSKSIYFDKPEESNWFVTYHQDLTISVDKRIDVEGYGPWTVKQNQFSVQPPLSILNENYTIRIHLDDTDENNGALKVISASHNKGIYRHEEIISRNEKEVICNVKKGGIMIMKPLLLHSSGRSINKTKRRVIHIEFSNTKLADKLSWSEKISNVLHLNSLTI